METKTKLVCPECGKAVWVDAWASDNHHSHIRISSEIENKGEQEMLKKEKSNGAIG